jgi:hypothetical protein
LTIWKGHNLILDGHNRYQICGELQVPFKIVEIDLSDRTVAKIWMIRNQKGRRNLDESQRAMLAVKLEAHHAEQAKERRRRTALGLNLGHGEFGRSAEKAARDMGVSHKCVYKRHSRTCQACESGCASVSAAAKVTSLAAKSQEKVVKKAEIQIKEGEHPNIAAIIRENVPKAAKNDPDEVLEMSRKDLNACLSSWRA